MALKTHTNFKSVYPNIQDADTMDDYVGLAIEYQYMFERKTTPWEKSIWKENKLEKFEVKLDQIDRLYYIEHFDDDVSGQYFHIVGRMDYEGKPVFVELSAGCDYTGFECDYGSGGEIFISMDANLFMKQIITNRMPLELIRQSLAEDGILLDNDIAEYDKFSRMD